MMTTDLIPVFRAEAQQALDGFPNLNHRWVEEPNALRLEFPKTESSGLEREGINGTPLLELLWCQD